MSNNIKSEVKVNNLVFDFIDPTNSIEEETFCGLGYEPGVCKLIESIVKEVPKDTIFLDIGAHYGFFPVFLSKIAPHIKTIAIEPGLEQLEVLRKNVENYAKGSEVIDLAFSDNNITQSFKGRKFVSSDEQSAYDVKTITGDAWLQEQQIKPAIIKLDVHGLEVKVLKGLKQTLKNDVKHLILEIHEEKLLQDGSYQEIYDILKESGFLIFEMINFRFSDEITLKMIDETTKDFFINFKFWPKADKMHEKMLYCLKP